MPAKTPAPAHHHPNLFSGAFWHNLGMASLDTAWEIAKIVVFYIILRAFLRRLVDRIIVPVIAHTERTTDASQMARIKTLAGLLNSAIGYILVFIFGVMLLRAVHLDPVPILTTASVAGLAVGFGAQKLVKDVISGFFILLENQYAVGDYVTIGAVTGTVSDVEMRTTRLRDDAGRLYILANGDITQVCNQSRGAMASFIEIGIAASADLKKATELINAAGMQLVEERKDLGFTDPPSVLGLGSADAAKLTLRVGCHTAAPAHLIDAQLALRGRIHQCLSEAGIGLG